MSRVFLSLGSNMGEREALLEEALEYLNQRAGHIVSRSSVFETEPWGYEDTNLYLNLAAELQTDLLPHELMDICLGIEEEMDRTRTKEGYEARPIDIDIVLYGNLVLDTDHCRIPHPWMHLRRFVLEPLREIAPETIHPILGKTIRELLEICPDR